MPMFEARANCLIGILLPIVFPMSGERIWGTGSLIK
jgi:hypothetical protein